LRFDVLLRSLIFLLIFASNSSKKLVLRIMFCGVLFWTLQCAQAQTVTWAGRSWKLTSGHMAGVASGSPANVTIDAHGYQLPPEKPVHVVL
jgi:hypothetical protein